MSGRKHTANNPVELGTESIGKLLWSYSLPAIIATTASSLYNIIDRIFIGQGVGALAISGLAITFPIMNLATAFGTLVGAGASAIVSIRLGEKRRIEAIRTLGNAFVLNIIIGIALAVLLLAFLDPILLLFGASNDTLPYARDFMQIILLGNVVTHLFFGLNSILRASGYPTKAMISILLTVGINIIVAPLFIFVFKWGIQGAAIATVISQTCGLIWVLAHFFNKKSHIHFQPAGFHLRGCIIRDIFSIGMSPFLIHSCMCLITILINLRLQQYGGDYAVGAYGIVNSVTTFIIMVVLGLTQGMQPIAGYNYGANLMPRVMKVFKLSVIAGTIITTTGFLILMIFPQSISLAFTNHEELVRISVQGMRLYVIFMPLGGFQIVTSNFYQAIGRAKTAIFLSLSRQVIFLIPFILLLPTYFGLSGVWYAIPSADLLSALVTAGVLLYSYKKVMQRKI
ncbi:MAG: MATE family efflux transporter [Bacteroidales bacterium]|nr:MATE family efflux transporter [Bacteroidales bacterium]